MVWIRKHPLCHERLSSQARNRALGDRDARLEQPHDELVAEVVEVQAYDPRPATILRQAYGVADTRGDSASRRA